jgi:fructosamine-3-kinase
MLETVQSPLIEPVTATDLIAILQATLDPQIELVEHRQITGGLFNTSYYLTTRAPAHEIILRIAPAAHKHTTLFDYEKTMMAAEPAIYDLMRDAGIPVPEVLALDTTGRVIPRQVILLRYLASTPMNDPTILDEAKPKLRQQLGTHLRQMHTITHDQFGYVQPDGTVKGSASWGVVFGALFDEALRHCHEHKLLAAHILQQAAERFAAEAPLFADPALRPALIHGDIWDANVLLQRDDTGEWQIAAIIDVDRALFADREFEASIWHNTPDFNRGYNWPLDDSQAAQSRRVFYKLYQDLFHTFVFGVQIPVPDYFAHHRQGVLDWFQNQ